MDVIKTLESYGELMIDANRYYDIYISLHDNIGGGAINYDGMPHGSRITSKTENDGIKLADAERDYYKAFNEATKRMLEIDRMINTVTEPRARHVLFEHYLKFRSFTSIAEDEIFRSSDKTVRRCHKRGIRELKKRYE